MLWILPSLQQKRQGIPSVLMWFLMGTSNWTRLAYPRWHLRRHLGLRSQERRMYLYFRLWKLETSGTRWQSALEELWLSVQSCKVLPSQPMTSPEAAISTIFSMLLPSPPCKQMHHRISIYFRLFLPYFSRSSNALAFGTMLRKTAAQNL